ncbi:phosphoribosyltransferase [Pseudokordiimonas caeni]|uniref:phosphoribosyltransferase n=1 Tax=Pseudokordiimonas caeni TaxID=2997908 RepID=UPI0028116F7E|nr:phosphoribosyltransferase [Pseudokordiimonas caeni]
MTFDPGFMFRDRVDAGRQLAAALAPYAGFAGGLVLALPRGGVPVAAEVASELHLPLDVYLVRKLGVPGHEELAMGAIAADSTCVLNNDIVAALRLDWRQIDPVVAREREELERRNRLYRAGRPQPDLGGRTVILIDDGLATGATMKAAIGAIRSLHPRKLVVAVPVGAPDICNEISALVDHLVCLYQPSPFQGVGRWYADFSQTTDSEVLELLRQARTSREEAADVPDRR